jgi:ferrous iron transport protein A
MTVVIEGKSDPEKAHRWLRLRPDAKSGTRPIIITIPINADSAKPMDTSPDAVVTAARLVPLSRIGVGQTVTIAEVRSGVSQFEGGDIGLRLLELGFVRGESLRIIAHGFPGGEPLAVRIGNTTFALRRFEADHVLVETAA